jgi:hypothetical protein
MKRKALVLIALAVAALFWSTTATSWFASAAVAGPTCKECD